MQVKKRDVEGALQKKGFKKDDTHHHYFIYHDLKGKRTSIKTRTSHGSNEALGVQLVAQMAKQLKISKQQFTKLVDCTLDQKGYDKLVARAD